MASYPFFNHSNNEKVRIFHSGEDIRGCSTTQMCLHKILLIISTFTPPESPKAPSLDPLFDLLEPNTTGLRGEDNRGFSGIDLNVPLGSPTPPPLETEQSESPTENDGPSACNVGGFLEVPEIDSPVVSTGSSTAEKDSVGGCDLREAVSLFGSDNTPEFEDGVVEENVIEDQRLKINNNGSSIDEEEQQLHSEGRLDLLIEAAKFISGGFEDGEPEPKKTSRDRELSGEFCRDSETREVTVTEAATSSKQEYSVGKGSKRRKQSEEESRTWMMMVDDLYGDLEDVSSVVRSKRGRSQVLPYKYRD